MINKKNKNAFILSLSKDIPIKKMKKGSALVFFLLCASPAYASDTEETPLVYDVIGDEEMQKPSCLGQSAAAVLNWLLCSCTLTGEVFSCCTRMPEPICGDATSCNPLQRRYVDPYRPVQEGLCHEGCFLACPCCYTNQIPYEGDILYENHSENS